MSEPRSSNFWLDVAADEIVAKYPSGEIIVSSGISPSASYHIGHFREIMTAEALAWVIRQRDRQAKHIHVVDNFDPLRKRYDFLPPEFDRYVGQPVALIPDPFGDCHRSYADHFYAEFESQLGTMGIEAEIVKSYEDLYRPGNMTPYIETVLESLQKSDFIRKIFAEVSNRELPPDWTPVQLLNPDTKIFSNGHLKTWDRSSQTLDGISYAEGNAKLNWRLDWPARWAYLKVDVEPFGAQEHGAAGGSYDTAQEFAKKVFGIDPPYGEVRYGHIHNVGETIKMSSSKGNGVSPGDALDIMPPEILRYFIVRSLPSRKLYFDPGIGLFKLIDEFAAAHADRQHPFRDAYSFAVANKRSPVISSVPFKHLVQVYQAAQGKEPEVLKILERTGYAEEVRAEREAIIAELNFVKKWLNKYAPPEITFSVQKAAPAKLQLNEGQKRFLNELASSLDGETELTGDQIHETIYEAAKAADIPAPQAFQALYQIIIAKDSGPKAGWFLASLDRAWLIKRLRLEG